MLRGAQVAAIARRSVHVAVNSDQSMSVTSSVETSSGGTFWRETQEQHDRVDPSAPSKPLQQPAGAPRDPPRSAAGHAAERPEGSRHVWELQDVAAVRNSRCGRLADRNPFGPADLRASWPPPWPTRTASAARSRSRRSSSMACSRPASSSSSRGACKPSTWSRSVWPTPSGCDPAPAHSPAWRETLTDCAHSLGGACPTQLAVAQKPVSVRRRRALWATMYLLSLGLVVLPAVALGLGVAKIDGVTQPYRVTALAMAIGAWAAASGLLALEQVRWRGASAGRRCDRPFHTCGWRPPEGGAVARAVAVREAELPRGYVLPDGRHRDDHGAHLPSPDGRRGYGQRRRPDAVGGPGVRRLRAGHSGHSHAAAAAA